MIFRDGMPVGGGGVVGGGTKGKVKATPRGNCKCDVV